VLAAKRESSADWKNRLNLLQNWLKIHWEQYRELSGGNETQGCPFETICITSEKDLKFAR
jgi:hypothetical protein